MRQARHSSGTLVVLGVLAAAAATACGGSPAAPSTVTYDVGNAATSITALPSLSEMIGEKTMGSATAPNTVIVYSSFTCSHCADFHLQTFPQLKSKYIDAGAVRYVFRDFERNDPDIRAAMLARCAGDAHYFAVVDVLFRNQAAWTGAANPNQAPTDLMRQLGMTQPVIDACVATTALSAAIVKSRDDALQSGVGGTPTFFVNGDVIVGAVPLSTIEAHFH
jgi:protein-disulfide isomerase